jgi:hypothetical protein
VRRALPIAAPAGASAPPAILPRGLIEQTSRAAYDRSDRTLGHRPDLIVFATSTAAREPIPNIMLSNAHRSATLAAFKTAQ